jgi:hypothetical protein
MNINEFIFKRLKDIQKRNNFNHKIGKIQIQNQPNKYDDYIIFAEYINLIKELKLELEINIPYDPLGLELKNIKLLPNKEYVYFAKLKSDSSIWKIGYSMYPYKRGQALQTGNHESITVMYLLDGGFDLEQLILRYTFNFKTTGGSEWRKLDNKQIKLMISRIKSEGTSFLNESLLK